MKALSLGLGLFGAVAAVPFVHADLVSSPLDFAMPIIVLCFLIGLIVGAVFLIMYIIKKIKAK